jgi:succinate dehydrogenase/fumarate reductase flavoprotein subunit
MTREQAIKLLTRETSIAEINRLKYEEGLAHEEVTEKIQQAMDMGVEAIKKQNNLIDKWRKKLAALDEAYIKNLRDKIKTHEQKFNDHIKIITRINELEMCIKDLKQLGGSDETNRCG